MTDQDSPTFLLQQMGTWGFFSWTYTTKQGDKPLNDYKISDCGTKVEEVSASLAEGAVGGFGNLLSLDIAKVFGLVRKLQHLTTLPDSIEQSKQQLTIVCELLEMLAQLSPTEIDDKILKSLKPVLKSKPMARVVYDLLGGGGDVEAAFKALASE